MDVGYDEVRILLAPDDVSLLFVRTRPLGSIVSSDAGDSMGSSEDYPLKVAYQLWGEPLPSGRLNLAEQDAAGGVRGLASRNVSNDPRSTLPSIVRGTLRFNKALEPGATVTGDFNITFENGIEAASGRTAFSTFSARVQP